MESLSALICCLSILSHWNFGWGEVDRHCCSPFVWKIISLLGCAKQRITIHFQLFWQDQRSDSSYALQCIKVYLWLCIWYYPIVHYKASIIKRSCCNETVYSGISLNVTLKDLENILPAVCQWISLLISAAASVTKRCVPISSVWESITTLCPWPSVAPLLPSFSHLPLGSQMKWKEKNYYWSLNLTAMNSFLQCHTVTTYRYSKKFFFSTRSSTNPSLVETV